tara:strand:- start:169 stop:564 length:396 start_codon:yes stop_codon:yes gene_type:complete
LDLSYAQTDHQGIHPKAFTNAFTIGYHKVTQVHLVLLPTTKRTMTRLKDQIRLAKKAIKEAKIKPDLYTDEELQYMTLALIRAKIQLKVKQQQRKQEKGFSNELSETRNSDTRRRENDGVRGESIEPKQSG